MNMKGMPNFGKSLLLSALVVALALMSCQKQENKPLSQVSAQPPLPQPRAMQAPPAIPAGADAPAILKKKKAPKDLTADDWKKSNAWSGQGVKDVADALNSAREAAITAETDTSTIRGACFKNHKVAIPYG